MSDGAPFKLDLGDLTGGLNADSNPDGIKDNEASRMRNWYGRNGKLLMRGGLEKLTTQSSNGYGSPTSVAQVKNAAGDLITILGASTGFYKQVGALLVPLANADGVTITADTRNQWQFRPYQNALYAARRDGPGLIRITEDYFQLAGIVPPVAKATGAAGAGTLDVTGDYRFVYTYYNSLTSAESDPSPPSDAVAITAPQGIAVTGIVASTNGQVDTVRLYVTQADQQGEYYFATSIANGLTTATISLTLDQFGRTVEFDNGVPPAGVEGLELYGERLAVHDSRDLYLSGLGKPEGFKASNVIQVSPDDGARIRALQSFQSDRMAIMRTNGLWVLQGSGASLRLDPLDRSRGAVSPNGKIATDRLLFWLGVDLNVYVYDGSDVRNISAEKVCSLIEDDPDSAFPRQYQYAVMALWPKKDWLLLSIFDENVSGRMLVFDYRRGLWLASFDYNLPDISDIEFAPLFATLGYDSELLPELLVIFNSGYLFKAETGVLDDGNSPVREWKGKAFSPGAAAYFKLLKRMFVQTSQAAALLSTSVYLDGSETAYASRDLSLDLEREWKGVNLATFGHPACTLQPGLNYDGAASFDIHGISMEGSVLKRLPKAL